MKNREVARKRRHERVRKKVSGSTELGRLTVFRSNLHIYAQIVDDSKSHTVVSASSLKIGSVQPGEGETRQIALAKAVGRELAVRAKEKGIERVAFDRSGYRYHGRIAALAQGARDAGLKF